MAGICIPLSGSTQCRAFNSSSISTNSTLYADFPFMQNVSNLTQFDQELSNYVKNSYVKQKYVEYLGCQGVNLTDTDDYYARYTTSTVCNGLVQSSKSDCNLSAEQSRPLCADTCALMATSEEEIVINSQLCTETNSNYMAQIRSDFTVCALPADSLSGTCISGADNEPDKCGYGSNVLGLCGYCAASSPNSTDSCCANSNAASQCQGITIPSSTATLPPILTSTSSSTTAASHNGLSGGQIAGTVIGSVAGIGLLAALAALTFLCMRRRRIVGTENALNQPNPQRRGPSMQHNRSQELAFVPAGRVARMSALREVPTSSPAQSRNSAALSGGVSDPERFRASPGAMSQRIPPVTGKRHGSLSSNSALAGIGSDTTSPRSGSNGQYSSPEGMTSGQSEQMSSFHDYYSQDSIQPGDKVAVLWAYQPRADDEFALDRGEMLKIIGIWDDGWATGIRVPESIEDYDARHHEQRDSGVSNGPYRPVASSPTPTGEIKAFPLVCVCLPQHWRAIIDAGGQGDDGS